MIIPAERLFWSVVEAPGVKGGALPAGLWPLIEDDLPVEAELAWAVGTPIDGDRLLVCAALKSELIEAAAPDGVLIPDRVPDFDANVVDLSLLNLLGGPFEPVTARKARQQRHVMTAAAALVAAILIGVGFERRAGVWHREALDTNAVTQSVIGAVAPSLGWNKDDLAMELLQRTQVTPVELRAPGDAAVALAGLIGRWPAQIPAKPQSILASGNSASVSVLIPPPGDAAAFIAALTPPEGWKLEEPRLVSVDKATRINLELRRVAP